MTDENSKELDETEIVQEQVEQIDDDETIEEENIDIGIETGQFDVKAHEILPKMYMSYALSVIKDRALPDIRDGLKPVARRLLYGMHEMGLTHIKVTRKSANVTGTVMARYHPHGDGNIYGTAVRLVQPFTTRYPLIIGQGNFGSPEDPPAAHRYTEMKLSRFSDEAILSDLDKETVDYMSNYDGTLQEPKVLPTKVPLLLLNGSMGIAVGMATSVPPHNLREVIDALLAFIENEDITLPELLTYIKGPDFPSAAYMFDGGMQQIYETGRGSVTLRAKTQIISQGKKQKQSIIITELPFQVDKVALITRLASLYQDKETKLEGIDGISDLRDESKADIRIVIELRKGVEANMVLNTLYRHTDLQCKHAVHMRALVNGVPKMVGLIEILKNFLSHRKDIVTRRTEFDLRNAERRCNLLKGFLIVFENLDIIITDVKTSTSNDETWQRLRKYNLNDEQIKAILDMKIQRLAQFERSVIVQEHDEIVQKINGLKQVLESEELVVKQIKDELQLLRHQFGDNRLTKIIPASQDSTEIRPIEEIQEEDVIVTVTRKGMIKRTPISEYRVQNVKGKGLIGAEVRDGDYIQNIFQLSTRDYTLVFTKFGKCYRMNSFEIPALGRTAIGSSILNILHLEEGDEISSIIPIKSLEDRTFVMVTKLGQIKRLKAIKLQRPRSDGTKVIKLGENDQLIKVNLLEKPDLHMLLVTNGGIAIRFEADTIRSSGKGGSGVRGIKLEPADFIVSANIISKEEEETAYLMTVTERGYSKRSILRKFRTQRRGGRGIICMDVDSTIVGKIIAANVVRDDLEQFILITEKGILIRLKAGQIRKLGRNTQGSRIQKLSEKDSVAAVAFIGIVEGDDDDTMEPADGGKPVEDDIDDKEDDNSGILPDDGVPEDDEVEKDDDKD